MGDFKLVCLKRVYQQGWPHSCWDHHMLGYLVSSSYVVMGSQVLLYEYKYRSRS